jgi:DNA (cytosine-5)-methyltransferase 1
MKVLNLYAGIGGNRKLWPEECEVTAVELNPKIAEKYQTSFPEDVVVVADAHKYLLEHYKEFDFIWSSPPCQSHTVCNFFLNPQGVIRYPDMKLYQEILFLTHFSKCKWVVENVKSYYEPLIKPQEAGRHYFWGNFHISDYKTEHQIGRMNGDNQNRERSYKLDQLGFPEASDEELRNCVNSNLGLHVFNCAFKHKQMALNEIDEYSGKSRLMTEIGKELDRRMVG